MGANLRSTLPPLLADRGMTQEQLAEATGLRRTDINALARGRVEAGPKRLRLIARALKVSPAELGGETEPGDRRARTLERRLEEAEAELARTGPILTELADRVEALERRAGGAARRGQKRAAR